MTIARGLGLAVLMLAASSAVLRAGEKYPPGRPFDSFDSLSVQAFSLLGQGWDGRGRGSANLNFHFLNGIDSSDFPGQSEQDIIRQALDLWASVVEINWTPVSTAGRNFTLEFGWFPLDGQGGTLAMAAPPPFVSFEPTAGDVTFDLDEIWTAATNPRPFGRTIELLPVAIHEIGHSLGLGHTADQRAVMFATYDGGSVSALSSDDIAGIRAIYAARFPAFAAKVYGSHTSAGDLNIRIGVKTHVGGTTLWERDVHLRYAGQRRNFDYAEIDLSPGRAFVDGRNDWYVSVEDAQFSDTGTLEGFEIRLMGQTVFARGTPVDIEDRSTSLLYIEDLGEPMPHPPLNDDCSVPTEVTALPFTGLVNDTSLATSPAGDPALSCGDPTTPAQSNSVWYRYVPERTGLVNIATGGSTYATVLAVFTGDCLAPTEVACAAGLLGDPSQGLVPVPADLAALPVQAGEPMLIEVAQLGGPGGGLLRLSITEVVTGDNCAQPIVILNANFASTLNTRSATSDLSDPFICKRAFATVWYEFVPPADGEIDIDTAGSLYDTVMAAFTGDCESLKLLACNNDFPEAAISGLPVTRDEPVRIMIGDIRGNFGGDLAFGLQFTAAPVLTASLPSDGFIDPLDEAGGIREIMVVFDRPVVRADGDPLDVSALTVMATGDETARELTIEAVDVLTFTCGLPPCPTTVTVTLAEPVPTGEWILLSGQVAGATGLTTPVSIRFAHLPCDVNQDGVVNIRDATAFGEAFRGDPPPSRIDLDRSGTISIEDATRFGTLWNGTGEATRAWKGARLSALPAP